MNKKRFLEALKSTIHKNKHTQKDIATLCNISQSQISKILRGNFSRSGKAVDALKQYSKYIEYSQREIISSEIENAISEVWDGSERMEKSLAKIIREIGGVWSA